MKKIIIPFHLFTAEQTILFYNEDGTCIQKDHVATRNIAATLIEICNMDLAINEIDLIGCPTYLNKIRKDIENERTNLTVLIIKR